MRVCLSCARRFQSADWRCTDCGWAPALHGAWPVFAPELAANNDGFSAEFFSGLFQAEAGHFWFRSRNRLLTWALRTYFPQARSLLEIGCGTGYVLAGIHEAFPDLACAGSEMFLEGLAFAQSRVPDVPLFQMSAQAIPFDSAFDVVGAFDVLEHIDDDFRAMQQMFQAVVPGGGIIVTVPQHHFLWSAVDEHSFHKRRYARADLVRKLEAAGFRGTRTTSFVSLLLPLMMVARMRRTDSGPFDALAELRIGDGLNGVLQRIMDLERGFITRGVALPAGGSLLAVARRPHA